MGDIARGRHRFVAGCARCLRTALAGIRTTDDRLDERRRTRHARASGQARDAHQTRGPSFTLAGTLLASSMAVASGSNRLRAALASIPLIDEEEGPLAGDRAGQAGLRRRMALASPAVAAGIIAGAVTPTPAQAQEAPTSAAPAPGVKTSTAQAPAQNPSPPPPPPSDPPTVIELVGGLGVPTPVGPWGGELGILVNPENGHIQLTGMGGLYAGGKVGVDVRQPRAPGVVGEAKVQQNLGPIYSAEVVGQTDLSRVGGSWKVQGPPVVPAFAGGSYEVLPNPSHELRGGGQARFPVSSPVFGAVGAVGVRGTTPELPIDIIQTAEDWQNAAAGPIDPARFEGQPAPEDPWVTFIDWVSDQFGSQGSPQPPATSAPPDWSEAGELGGAYAEQIGAPIGPGGGELLGQFMERIAASASQGAAAQPVDPTQLGEQFAEAWNEFAEAADPSGGLGATVPAPSDLAAIGEALNQLWGQTAAPPAPAAVPTPLPALPPAFDQLIARDPALAQLLAQLVAQDPALAQLLVQDPALAQLLAQNPGLARALAQDPTLAPALSQAIAPAPAGEAGVPGMDWEQILQDMNGPVLVDPESFQNQPASDTDGVDVPAFDVDDAESEDDGQELDADAGGGEGPLDDSTDEEPESDAGEEDFEPDDVDGGEELSDDGSDEDVEPDEGEEDFEPGDVDDGGDEPSDDGGDEDVESDEGEDDAEPDEPSDDGGDEEPESDGEEESEPESDEGGEESDDDGGDEPEPESDEGGEESDDDGGDEPEPESDDGGGEEEPEPESDGGGGGGEEAPAPESDGGGEPAPEGGGGGGGPDGGGGEAEAPAPASPEPAPAPEEPAESAPEPDYSADSSWTGMVEGSGPCDVC